MKTRLFTLVASILVFSAFSFGQATSNVKQITDNPVVYGRGVYIDTDNDGVCDTYQYRVVGQGRAVAATTGGQGLRNGMGAGRGPGLRRGLAPGNGRGFGPGQGRGLGPGQGRGTAPGGRFYTDDDNSGVCDRYEQIKKN